MKSGENKAYTRTDQLCHLVAVRERSGLYGILLVKARSLMEGHGKYIHYRLDTPDYDLIFRSPTDDEIEKMHDMQLGSTARADRPMG